VPAPSASANSEGLGSRSRRRTSVYPARREPPWRRLPRPSTSNDVDQVTTATTSVILWPAGVRRAFETAVAIALAGELAACS
jgi:hypothetical protein